jgi:hypothetical protein
MNVNEATIIVLLSFAVIYIIGYAVGFYYGKRR